MSKITLKSTKEVIYAALKEAEKQLEEKSLNRFNPVEQQIASKKEEVKAKAESFNKEFKPEEFSTQFTSLVEKITLTLEDYNNMLSAIKEKKEELKKIYDIEVEANTLFALLNSKSDLAKQYDAEISELKNQYAESRKQLEIERKKEEEEYTYNRNRQRKIENDMYEDKVAEEKKKQAALLAAEEIKLKEFEKELDSREVELVSREDKVSDVEDRIAKFEVEKQDAVNKAVEDTKSSMSKSFTFEKTMMKKESENTIALLENKIENLEATVEDLRERNAELSRKLDESYNRFETITSKTIEGTANQKVINAYEASLKTEKK